MQEASMFPIGTRVRIDVPGRKSRTGTVIGDKCRELYYRRIRYDGAKEPRTINIIFLTVLESPASTETEEPK